MLAYVGIRYFMLREFISGFDFTLLLIPMTLNVAISSYVMAKDGSLFKNLSSQIEIKEDSYKNIETLNRDLRSQRHDFLNHIQILYSLMELGEYDETRSYLNRLYGDVGKLSANIKTQSVAVNALIQAKSNEAENIRIRFNTSINARLDSMTMPDWELCRVLSNLIDNAFDGALASQTNPYATITLTENITDYLITIENPTISALDSSLEVLFEAGYTTKANSDNHGMGLFISHQLMSKYGNLIELIHEDGVMKANLTLHKLTVET
jgi:sensor histidine kinase regulating citrate/malate metabolism